MTDEIIHGHALGLSSQDTIALAEAVRQRFNSLVQHHIRIKGRSLIVPKDMVPDYQRVLILLRRYHKRDPRNSEAELKSLKVFAQWTLSTNCELRGQKPIKLDCLEP